MHNSGKLPDSVAEKRVLVVGGCHGTCLVIDLDEECGTGGRQILLGNCVVLTICLAIGGVASALVWI